MINQSGPSSAPAGLNDVASGSANQSADVTSQRVMSPGTGAMNGVDVGVGRADEHVHRDQVIENGNQAKGFFGAMWNIASDLIAAGSDTLNAMHGFDPHEFTDEVDGDISEVDDDTRSDISDEEAYYSADEGFDELDAQALDTRSAVDADSELRPLGELLGSDIDDLPPMEVGNADEQAVANDKVQAQNQDNVGWLTGALNAALGGVAYFLPQVGRENQLNQNVGAPQQTVAERNLAEIQRLESKIADDMGRLAAQLHRLGVGDPHASQPPQAQIDRPELGVRDNLNRWYHQVRGAGDAAVSTVGHLAIGAAIPGVASVVSTPLSLAFGPIAGLSASATGVLSGAYYALTTLQNAPNLANNQAAVSMVNEATAYIAPDLQKLADLKGQESARQTSAERIAHVAGQRSAQLSTLQAELVSVSAALENAPAELEEAGDLPLRHDVEIGDGHARAEVQRFATRAREAFSSAMSSIGAGLTSAGRFIADLPSVPGRIYASYSAGKAEQAYAKEEKEALAALAYTVDNSQIKNGVDVRADERARANGAKPDFINVRAQCQMGENLTLALLTQDGQSFGAVEVKGAFHDYAISATLTTTRAMAWYLDAIAVDAPADGNGPPAQINDRGAPTVMRNEDGSLTVSDPGRKLYSFMMNAPTAHGIDAGNDGDQQSLAFKIDDHRQGMPQGMYGMKFETRLNDDRQETLHLSFTPKSSAPVYKPLNNEKAILLNIYQAAHSSNQPVAPGIDHSTWTRPQLEARQEEINAEIQRTAGLSAGDNQQLEALQDWRNPAFLTGRA